MIFEKKYLYQAVVISDIAGHYEPLEQNLFQYGVVLDENFIPDDVVLIFNGDLIHRGPDSIKILQKVETLRKQYPEQIVVNVGNHEANYLTNNRWSKFSWSEPGLDTKTVKNILQTWWNDDVMKIGCGIKTENQNFLVVHGGMSLSLWNFLQNPLNVEETLTMLGLLKEQNHPVLWTAGAMMGEYHAVVGPIWVSASENAESWLKFNKNFYPNFHQIHGHSNLFDWNKNFWWSRDCNIRERTLLNTVDKQSCFFINKKDLMKIPSRIEKKDWLNNFHMDEIFKIFGTDPGHGFYPTAQWDTFLIKDCQIIV